ncbi:phosphatidylinositol transfer protein [Ditylenchus destructor]|nr:phosphatidylinositol transfer protein [Ditylenchus destructor]
MPLSLDEYEKGQRYSVSKSSLNETGGGQGVEILKSEPFESDTLRPGQVVKGTYTHKIYHLYKKAPWFMRKILPEAFFNVEEESWNAFPYSKTVITNPEYMEKDFYVIIETMHTEEDVINDNALDLNKDVLKGREVIYLDIYDETHLKPNDTTDETNPRIFRSTRAGFEPLTQGWAIHVEPRIIVYKNVQVYFKWFGLQNRVERYFHKSYPRLFMKFNREMFCWIDEWIHLSDVELDNYERDAIAQLRRNFAEGQIRGMKAVDE